ncbi:MAG: hypothetical protein CMG45_06470 [Candidatus Marinimicrobia bacterium]|nr:hypothetical protein [Candidatus Neomarinimicrobiota bacterium]
MYLIKSILLYTSLLTSNYEISFVRFYANESDYISDIRLLATQRFAQSHMQVFYNDQKIPQIKEWLDDKGETIKWEVLDYKEKRLIRRYFLNIDQKPDSLIQFGQDEPWSQEFRKSYDKSNRQYYEGQESKFILNESSQIDLIQFTNVQGKLYGEIDFIYNHLGLLIGEVWRELPSQKIVRRFAYSIDMLTMKKEIWEYDKNGQEVSYVVLIQPPADELYKTLPPRFGNRLDEISVLLEDIRSRDIKIPFDVFIPKTDYDLMILTNNDSLMVEIIELGQQKVTFKIIGESDQLTMPKIRVKSITSKYGERIFP